VLKYELVIDSMNGCEEQVVTEVLFCVNYRQKLTKRLYAILPKERWNPCVFVESHLHPLVHHSTLEVLLVHPG
jgi:hypothetical protein